MKQTFEQNARTLRRLHQAMKDTFSQRSASQEDRAAWERACNEFHSQYDALAFPGGLRSAFKHLAAGNLVTAETAITYLEVHPYFFRSQYHVKKFIQLLKKIKLEAKFQKRFDVVLEAARERKLRRSGRPWLFSKS
jgi:hypothetical protein